MGRKKFRLLLLIPGIIAGFLAVVLFILQILLNSPLVPKIINKLVAENVDGSLNYSGIHISLFKEFPSLTVDIEDASLTYPHDRFSVYDEADVTSNLLSAGRGAGADTLARFGKFSASVNPWRLMAGTIRVNSLSLDSPAFYFHQFDSTSNLNMFRGSGSAENTKQDTTESKGASLPLISVGDLCVSGSPRFVYTAQFDTVYADLGFKKISLSGCCKLDFADNNYSSEDLALRLDSLLAQASLPADSTSIEIQYLELKNPMRDVLDLGLRANAFAWAGSYGRFYAPLSLDSRLDFNRNRDDNTIIVDTLHAEIAHIPLDLKGSVRFADSTTVRADAVIAECDLGTIWNEYGRFVLGDAEDIIAGGHLSLTASAEGRLGKAAFPDIILGVNLPDASAFFRSAGKGIGMKLDLDATLNPEKKADARLTGLSLSSPGLKLSMNGTASDLLGRDPFFDVKADGKLCVDSLKGYLPKNINLVGDLFLKLKTAARLSELTTLKFRRANVSGTVSSGRLEFAMPDDSIGTRLNGTNINLSADPKGIIFDMGLDSMVFTKGSSMRARVRSMNNKARLYMVEHSGKKIPRLTASTHNRSISYKSGTNRFIAFGVDVDAAVQERIRHNKPSGTPRRQSYRDSLDTDFNDRDIAVRLDSSWARFFDTWNPSFSIKTRKMAVMTPMMPLRTRVDVLSCSYENNILSLDSLGMRCGTSDLFATGEIKGMRRILAGKKGLIRADLEVDSKRINANEILVALEKAKTLKVKDSEAEQDESFVVDSIAGAKVDSASFKLFALPGNIVANLGLEVSQVEYLNIVARPLTAYAKLQDRTLQITDANLLSDIGNINLSAFYSTKNKQSLYSGFYLGLSRMSAYDIIHLIPTVDDLMPALKSFEGKLGCDISVTSQLDTNMNVIIPTLNGLFKISGEDLKIRDLGAFKKVARLLLFKDTKVGNIQNMHVNGSIHDSKLELFPFELDVDRYALAFEGTHGYDNKMNYHLSVMKSPLLIPFGINITGSADKWKIGLCRAKYKSGNIPAYTAQLDTMQINIIRSIKSIFRKGEIEAMNRDYADAVRRRSARDNNGMDISSPEYQRIDSLLVAQTAEEINCDIEKETENIVSDALVEVEKMNANRKPGILTNSEKRKLRSTRAK